VVNTSIGKIEYNEYTFVPKNKIKNTHQVKGQYTCTQAATCNTVCLGRVMFPFHIPSHYQRPTTKI